MAKDRNGNLYSNADKEIFEKKHLGGRIRRYAKISRTIGEIAVRWAGEQYFGFPLKRAKHATNLRHSLGELKGPLMKIAQFLSTVPEGLPPEYVRELSELQAQAPPMGPLFVKRRMANELDLDWREKYTAFNHHAAAAASLGQVHQARSLDGRLLACKLQYPDMEATIDADLKQFKFAIGLYERFNKALVTEDIYQEISDRLHEEVDYEREAKNLNFYKHMLRDIPNVVIPDVLPELTTNRLLTMTWLEGRPLLEMKDQPFDVRNHIARAMFRIWYLPLYHYSVIHGDPHLGNYNVDKDLKINLLDFGCIRVFPTRIITGVIELYYALLDGNKERAVNAYKLLGFKNISQELIDVLNIWAEFLYRPLLEDRVQPIDQAHSAVYGREMAAKVHRELNRIGGVRPPREFVLIDRAAVGMGSVFMHLKAEVNWCQEFRSLIEGFDDKKVEERQRKVLEQVGLEPPV
jgi:predicted unusual protein kinase regulating ubiquinone biosynthesis (AarF/ABC1/UbiB family)